MSDYLERLKQELAEVDTHKENEQGDAVEIETSKTVLNLDNWSHRRGEELHDAIIESGGSIKDKYTAADFFSLAFEPESEFAEHPEDKARRDFIDTLTQTVEFRDLHSETMLNEFSSELAAMSFAKQFDDLSAAPTEQEIKKKAKEALDDAKESADDARAMTDAVGAGAGGEGGENTSPLDSRRALDLMKRAKSDQNIRAIINIAGRFRRFAQSAQNSKVVVGKDDVTGIKLGNDLSKLLQSEKMKLTCGIEEIEDITAMRLLQKRCMIRETSATVKESRGPVVICVDESGSMEGEKVQEAKAIALAMYWIAKQQGRWCCLYGYSGGTEGNYLVLRPGSDSSSEIMEWLSHFYSYGTACDVPIDKLPEQWDAIGAPKGKTDIVFLTDALVKVEQSTIDDFVSWKTQSLAKVQTVIVGRRSLADRKSCGQLSEVSDNLIVASGFGLEQSGKPIEELFRSI